jgi:hypothetical protein
MTEDIAVPMHATALPRTSGKNSACTRRVNQPIDSLPDDIDVVRAVPARASGAPRLFAPLHARSPGPSCNLQMQEAMSAVSS